jgi:hypothetical protein
VCVCVCVCAYLFHISGLTRVILLYIFFPQGNTSSSSYWDVVPEKSHLSASRFKIPNELKRTFTTTLHHSSSSSSSSGSEGEEEEETPAGAEKRILRKDLRGNKLLVTRVVERAAAAPTPSSDITQDSGIDNSSSGELFVDEPPCVKKQQTQYKW